ncbi:PEP-utilizing enzyme, partial [Paractinoplanes brasiliensis]
SLGVSPHPAPSPGDPDACPVVALSRDGLAGTPGAAGLLARGRGASPGVATGRVALTADAAVRMHGPVVLVRPETSPLDMHGLAAAVGVVTARGGLASHAAVVARALNKPAVVGVNGLDQLTEGIEITIDGTSGEIARGAQPTTTAADDPHVTRLLTWADAISGDDSPRPAEARLTAARTRL